MLSCAQNNITSRRKSQWFDKVLWKTADFARCPMQLKVTFFIIFLRFNNKNFYYHLWKKYACILKFFCKQIKLQQQCLEIKLLILNIFFSWWKRRGKRRSVKWFLKKDLQSTKNSSEVNSRNWHLESFRR